MGKRKVLAADAKLAEKFSELAKSKGMTVYSLLNKILEAVLELEEHGISFNQALEEYVIYRLSRTAGMALAPIDDVRFEKEQWYIVGERIGALLRIRGEPDIKIIEKAIAVLVPQTRLSVDVAREKGGLRVVLAGNDEASISAALDMIRGLCRSLGINVEIIRSGNVGMAFIKRGEMK